MDTSKKRKATDETARIRAGSNATEGTFVLRGPPAPAAEAAVADVPIAYHPPPTIREQRRQGFFKEDHRTRLLSTMPKTDVLHISSERKVETPEEFEVRGAARALLGLGPTTGLRAPRPSSPSALVGSNS